MPGRAAPSAKRYARAAFELAQSRGEIEVWIGMLGEMAAAAEHPEFTALLNAPGVPAERKLAAVAEVLPRSTELGRNFLVLVAQRRALAVLPRIVEEFQARADDAAGVEPVELVTAIPLDAAEQERARARLATGLGKEVRLSARVDPKLLGGMVFRVGDRVVDGSTRERLEVLRRSLVAGTG